MIITETTIVSRIEKTVSREIVLRAVSIRAEIMPVTEMADPRATDRGAFSKDRQDPVKAARMIAEIVIMQLPDVDLIMPDVMAGTEETEETVAMEETVVIVETADRAAKDSLLKQPARM